MPICIECCYPVPQLYHVLHSRSQQKVPVPPAVPPKPSTSSSSTGHNGARPVPPPRETKAKAVQVKGGGVGGDVRLTQCPRCKRFADKYVEHDYVVLFIDLVLVKPQVYRHLLFNRLYRDDEDIDPSIIRLGTLLLLFDVYITWSHIENLPAELISGSRVTNLPILLQYCFFLFLCLVTTLSQHVTIRWLARLSGLSGSTIVTRASDTSGQRPSHNRHTSGPDHGIASANSSNTINSNTINPSPNPAPPPPPPPTSSSSSSSSSSSGKPSPNSISTALFVSSCMSLFPLLMVVWKYDDDAAPSSSGPLQESSRSTSSIGSSSSSSSSINSNITFANGFLSPLTGQAGGGGINWVRKGVSWIVAAQNLEALRILLDCSYLGAGGLVLAGELVKWTVRRGILRAVGLGDAA